MMDDICAHIVDLAVNSISAGAKHVKISIEKSNIKNELFIKVSDDGKGIDEATIKQVIDPFFSTKTGRKVGLGIPLLKGTAETCGGSFHIASIEGKGTEIMASFPLNHPDLPPIGNIKDTILVLSISNPEIDFFFDIKNDIMNFTFNTKEIKTLLNGLTINSPEVIKFLKDYLEEHLDFFN